MHSSDWQSTVDRFGIRPGIRPGAWRALLGTAGVLLYSTAMGAADAQRQQSSRAKDGTDSLTLEEVIVTATKREESLQRIPQAITAITSERLDELNALSFQDYFRDVPGLMMDVDHKGHLDFSVRGTTSAIPSIPSTSASVAQYIDEIPVTATQAQIDMRLVDVERIEVLRGPQGTYYGEGALGGTIRVITKKPDLDDFQASVEGRVSQTSKGGTNDQESVMLNVPIIDDKLAVRVNYFNATDSGYLDVVNRVDPDGPGPASGRIVGKLKEDANSTHAEGGRVMALFAPTDSVTILAEAITTETTVDQLSIYNASVGDLTATVSCPIPECFYSGQEQSADLYNLTVDVDLGWGSLVSASSWADTERKQTNEAAQQGASEAADDLTFGEAFTQELRLVSSTEWSQRWDYVVGAFYAQSDADIVGRANVGTAGVPYAQTLKQAALFGELGYQINDRWSVRVGARGANLQQDHTLATPVYAAPGNPQVIGFDYSRGEKDYNPVTGRFVLNYAVNEHAIVYGTVASGFRQGGANLPSPDPNVTIEPFYDPDEAINYEIGWKISFPSLKATLNGAIYHIDWKDVQTIALSPTQPAFNYYRNGGDVVVDGFELEGGLELLKGLTLRGSFSYIDARLAEDYVYRENPRVLHGLKGDSLPFVAPISGSLSLNYRRLLGSSGLTMFGIVNSQYQDKRKTDYNANLPSVTYATMSDYWLTGAQLGIESDRWRAALYADNVFDKRAQLVRYPAGPLSPGEYLQVTTRPRTVGLFLRYSFD